MAKEVKKERFYHGMPIDSDEEEMMLMYIEELIEHGYAEKVERAPSFELSSRLVNEYQITEHLKTKDKIVDKKQVLLEEHIYTPEFAVIWLSKATGIFKNSMYSAGKKLTCPFIGDSCSWLEIKPEHDKHNMTRLFMINRKWMYKQHGIFVNLIMPSKLFEETFTPNAYLLTRTGKKRVIHWDIRTIDEYVASLNK